MLLATIVGAVQSGGSTPAQALTNTLTLDVIAARTEPRAFGGDGVSKGDAVTEFSFLVNIDNTGTTEQRSPSGGCAATDPGYPDSCNWPSIKGADAPSPIYTHGNQDDVVNGLDLPDGRYLISVLADGYKLDGVHVTVPVADPGVVTVELQPQPLPDSTMRGQVFADMAPTNGVRDVGDPGLAGFSAVVLDYLGDVTTDVYGNPLCTVYEGEDPVTHEIPLAALDGDMLPIPVSGTGGQCLSDTDGLLTVPHLGSNRYTLSAVPPDGQTWIQTTTLEGNHDWDTWVMEGATGYDTEFVLAGEPVPQPLFGFAQPTNTIGSGSGHIIGTVAGIKTYTPPKGGAYNFWGGNTGTKLDKPIDRPWISLADLQAGDAAVWVGQGDANGKFDIAGVPDGNYMLSWWDEPQDYNLNLINVTVTGGEIVDMGVIPLNGWWTTYEGYVFNDVNRDGDRDAGEPGVPNYTITLRRRDNSLMDRGLTTVSTDQSGYYFFESAYPLGEWTVMEAYSDTYYTTGITYQADNQPTPTTVKGAGVDVSTLNIIGLSGKLDWGVHAYDPTGTNGIDPKNGGIVGTVSYDTTRNELDPQYATTEDWQPGVNGLTVELHAPVDCGTNPGTPCDPDDYYELAPDGSLAKGQLLNTYVTETWERPTGCTARDVDGNALVHGVDENVLVTDQETDGECLESFMQGVQIGPYATDVGTPDANFGAAVDGNYGFGDGCFAGTLDASDPADPVCVGGSFEPLLSPYDYLVTVDIPDDASGTPMYQVTREEDINIGNGNQVIPQVPPPACAGAQHTVDVAGIAPDGPDAVVNPTFVDIGGSPYEGQQRPLCDTKLVSLNSGKSIVPIFNIFTDVPIPSRLRGLAVDDVNFSTDSRSTMYGEKTGIPFIPIGIYDFTNRLVYTAESDFNGVYDVLLPSTNHISCPTPSGICANMFRFVANDPGVPGALNPNYNPRYRTIATEFEAWPGLNIPTDLAPTQVGLTIEAPGTGISNGVTCGLDTATPQLLAVSRPFVNGSGTFTIEGTGFGAAPGSVSLDGTIPLTTTTWSNTHLDVTVPAGTAVGAHQLVITAANGQHTVNALTFHVLGTGYNPTVREVGPNVSTARYNPTNAASRSALGVDHAIQNALDDALANNGDDLVVVYPGVPDLVNVRNNPRGAYYENLIVASPVKLQGVGPGGFQGNTFVPGSILDGGAYGGDTDLATDWYTKVGSLTWDGNQAVNDGEVVYVLASANATSATGRARQFTSGFRAAIDGFDIRGGDQRGFPGNINDLTGAPTGLPPGIVTQGGAVFANAYARYLQITNNVIENNGGGYGAVRIGTPDLPTPDTSQHNENVRIANNRIISNAGTNLAGGVGIFAGSDGYEVTANDICGNFSVEYGGGLSVYGRSPDGKIHDNRVYFNGSNDEGGGIMIAGELPATAGALSPGSGPVDIYDNQIQANIANDDGGGLRFLMAGGAGGVDAMNVYNNFIVNNVSTHEGGGVGINDAPNVRIFNNTIMKNITTATAVTSNGAPVPAGISTSANSDQLQATLPGASPAFSNPLLFNNILWDNRAGTRAGTTVTGIGLAGDPNPIDHWDVGVADGTGVLAPTNSVIQQSAGSHPYTTDASNSTTDPGVVSTYDVSVSFATWRQNAGFVDSTLVALEAPPNLLGDYHLSACPGSPACDLGAASKSGVNAPPTDIDGQTRPAGAGFDSGADEFGASTPPPPTPAGTYFSTSGNANPPGVSGTADDSDVYFAADAGGFSRVIDVTAAPYNVPSGANADGYARIDATRFYMSFSAPTSVPGVGTVADEDIVYWNGSSWSMWFDGSAHGLSAFIDLGAISIVGNTLYFSTNNNVVPTGAGGSGDNADIYRWNPANDSYTRIVDATAAPFNLPNSGFSFGTNNPNVDGLVVVDATHFYMSFSNTLTNMPGGLGYVQDEDIVYFDGSSWSVFYDGTAAGLTGGSLDIDAFSFDGGAAPPGGTPPTTTTTTTTTTTQPSTTTTTTTQPSTTTTTTTQPSTTTTTTTQPSTTTTTTTQPPGPTLPNLPLLDNFNRTNANNLGANWSQLGGSASIGVNANQALASSFGYAVWNGTGNVFGASQGAAYTFSSAQINGSWVILKATGGTATTPSSFIAVQITGSNVMVSTTTNTGASIVAQATFPATFASGDTITATADATGHVYVWKTSGTATTLVGDVAIPASGPNAWPGRTGGGRIGLALQSGGRADNFQGGSLP